VGDGGAGAIDCCHEGRITPFDDSIIGQIVLLSGIIWINSVSQSSRDWLCLSVVAMDNQQVQSYIGLIEQLLGCPQGKESELLQANAELVDTELIKVMEQLAVSLESQGNSNNAEWLRGFAAQLTQVLEINVERTATESPGQKISEQFLLETFQLITTSHGNPQLVYPIWTQQLRQLDQALLVSIPKVVASLVGEYRHQKNSVAATVVDFGNLIQQFPLGNRWLNLELAIAAYQEALSIITQQESPEQWATILNNLANTYKNRIRGDRAENIEQAIAIYQKALTVRTNVDSPIAWAQTMSNLANAYTDRIQGDKSENIENAISAYQQALTVTTQVLMPIEWAQIMNNLANTYKNRIRGIRADNIEQAIAAYHQVLAVRVKTDMPIAWANTMMNLANAYYSRIQGDHADNIEQAIIAYQQALTVRTRESFPVDWATTMMNLASAYYSRIRGNHAENIEQAITAYQRALTVRTQESFPVDWATTMMNLASAYYSRIRGDHAENIEQAITAYEQALTVRTREFFPIDWATTIMNLANAYYSRIFGDRAENIEQAITAYQQALTVRTRESFPVDWATTMVNLASAYYSRIYGDNAENTEQAIAAYHQALTVFQPEQLSDYCRGAARKLGDLYSTLHRWEDATLAYGKALQAAEILYQKAIFLDSRASELSETADLPHRMVYALARTGNIQAAIMTLEQGRARGLSESLNRDRANLTKLQQRTPSLYTRYRDITKQLRNLESQQRDRMTSEDRHSITPETLRHTATKLRADLEETIAQIRQVPGYENFFTPIKWEDIAIALRPNNPLLYLVTTSNGSLTIVATPDNIEAIWSDFTETQLRELVQTWFNAYSQQQDNRSTWLNTIDATTLQLWDSLMGPIAHHLKTLGFDRATLIPTGDLSLLPLHAAWTYDLTRPTGKRYALDDIHFTYAPNARSLNEARAIADRVKADTILAIDDPRNDLPNSQREIDCAIDTFTDHTVLRHDGATIAAVQAGLAEASIVHFSCHGIANLTEPLNSGLAMSDGLLTLRDLFDLKLADDKGIRLAILSACETGLPGLENIDEVVSLPIGLLQAGVAGVIASLWAVSDLSTMFLLSKFYELWREHNIPADEALRQAQIWLRDSTNGEKISKYNNMSAQTRMPSSTNQNFYEELAWEPKNERSFSHPFHWAAFQFVGI
jgi:CHAT domain-containing protein/tetratricopeptide (TPR) repeat protein